MVRGRLPAGATVRAFARTNEALAAGEEVESIELPVEVDEAAGRFAVRVKAAELPDRYFAQREIIDVQVVAERAGGKLWIDHTSAKAVRRDARVVWTSPQASAPRSGARFGRLSDRHAAGGVAVGKLTEVPGSADTGSADTRTSRAGTCSTKVVNRRRVRARIADTYPIGKSRAWLAVDHSNGGMYQYTMKVPKHPREKMGMMHARGSWGVTSGRFRHAKKHTIAVRYRVVDNGFQRTDGTCGYYITHEPAVELGGHLNPNIKRAKPRNFKNCTRVARRSTWRRIRSDGSPYRRSYGVSAGAMVGVNLAVTKNYGKSTHVVKYKIRGSRKKWMCGNNRFPSVARRVMEKRSG